MVHFVNGLLLHSFADSRPATTQHFLNLAPGAAARNQPVYGVIARLINLGGLYTSLPFSPWRSPAAAVPGAVHSLARRRRPAYPATYRLWPKTFGCQNHCDPMRASCRNVDGHNPDIFLPDHFLQCVPVLPYRA